MTFKKSYHMTAIPLLQKGQNYKYNFLNKNDKVKLRITLRVQL